MRILITIGVTMFNVESIREQLIFDFMDQFNILLIQDSPKPSAIKMEAQVLKQTFF